MNNPENFLYQKYGHDYFCINCFFNIKKYWKAHKLKIWRATRSKFLYRIKYFKPLQFKSALKAINLKVLKFKST